MPSCAAGWLSSCCRCCGYVLTLWVHAAQLAATARLGASQNTEALTRAALQGSCCRQLATARLQMQPP